MTQPASGTHTRVQMQREGHALIPHGTVQSYDPNTGVFTAFMDFQEHGDPVYTFTPEGDAIEQLNGSFLDQNGLAWTLIR